MTWPQHASILSTLIWFNEENRNVEIEEILYNTIANFFPNAKSFFYDIPVLWSSDIYLILLVVGKLWSDLTHSECSTCDSMLYVVSFNLDTPCRKPSWLPFLRWGNNPNRSNCSMFHSWQGAEPWVEPMKHISTYLQIFHSIYYLSNNTNRHRPYEAAVHVWIKTHERWVARRKIIL